MTKLLEKAIAKLRELPSDRQDEATEFLLSLVEQDPEAIRLSQEQVAEVGHCLGEPAEYVTYAEVRAFFQKPAV